MGNQYIIPFNMREEVKELAGYIDEFLAGNMEGTAFRAKRVPFGMYEQRELNVFMYRIRAPGGIITPAQLIALADISDEYGADHFALTSRGGIQVHNIKLKDAITVINLLLDHDLSPRGGGGNTVRNILSPPDSGVDKDEVFNVTPYAVALTNRLVAESDSWSLPRKFKISFTGNPKKGLIRVNDVGFLAKIKDGKKGFQVTYAGGMGANSEVSKPLFDFVEDDQVYFIVKAIKNLFYKNGNRRNKHIARLRFLMKKWGEEKFRSEFEKEYQDALSKYTPLKLEKQRKLIRIDAIRENPPKNNTLFEEWKEKYCTFYKDYLYNIEIPVYLGTLYNTTARKLADMIYTMGEDIIRIDTTQNLLLRAIPEGFLGEIFNFVQEEFPFANDRPLNRIICCTGAATCKIGICFSRALTDAIGNSAVRLDEFGDAEIKISGCLNNCAQHAIADLGFFGRVGKKDGTSYPAYMVLAGAKLDQDNPELVKPLGSIGAKSIPQFLQKLIDTYKKDPDKYEDFKTFLRTDPEKVKEVIDSFSNVPTIEENPDYYYDWGCDQQFSLSGRGEDECSASAYDLIKVFFKQAAELEKQLSGTKEDADSLKEIVILSAKAILITQGVDVTSNTELLDYFKKLFIDKKLLPSDSLDIINMVIRKGNDTILANRNQILKFSKSLKDTYTNMDETFRVKTQVEEKDSSKLKVEFAL